MERADENGQTEAASPKASEELLVLPSMAPGQWQEVADTAPETVAGAEPATADQPVDESNVAEPVAVVQEKAPARIEAYGLKVAAKSIHLTIKANRPIGDFRDVYLAYKNVLYYDLPGKWELANQLPTTLKVDFPGFGPIRTGLHKEYLRIVFNLDKAAFSGTEAQTTEDGLVITINP